MIAADATVSTRMPIGEFAIKLILFNRMFSFHLMLYFMLYNWTLDDGKGPAKRPGGFKADSEQIPLANSKPVWSSD